MRDDRKWLHGLHMEAADIVTDYICDGAYVHRGTLGEVPDGADVHEDVRESLQRIFDQIEERLTELRAGAAR